MYHLDEVIFFFIEGIGWGIIIGWWTSPILDYLDSKQRKK